nr:immunoglobulin heavy chain junction region [Macaca mulatta]
CARVVGVQLIYFDYW